MNAAEPPKTKATGQDALTVSDLTFSYGKGAPLVLDIPSFQLERGERAFLHGPSGSGKTTLLGLLAGILTPQSGKIQVLGEDFTSMDGYKRDRFRGSHFGYIFQMFNLIPYLSVRQNIELPLGISQERAQRVGDDLDRVTSALAANLSIDRLLDKSVTELSVGQQQRVAAARALIGSPEIIVADEPTSALDTDQREAFLRTMFRVAEGCGASILFVSHDHTLRPLFNRVMSLGDLNRAQKS